MKAGGGGASYARAHHSALARLGSRQRGAPTAASPLRPGRVGGCYLSTSPSRSPPAAVPLGCCKALTALFALTHGVAHGLELPDLASPFGYAIGFIVATAALHAIGFALVRFLPQAAAPLVRIAGAASAATGVWLLAS